jgi:hypothetical protein
VKPRQPGYLRGDDNSIVDQRSLPKVPIPSEEELLEDERELCDHICPFSCRKGLFANMGSPLAC